MDAILDSCQDIDWWDAAGCGVGVDDGADDAGVGSGGSLSDLGDVAEIHGIDLSEDNWAVLEWGGDVGASAGGGGSDCLR